MKGFGKGMFPRPKDAAEMQRFASDRKHRFQQFVGSLHDFVAKDMEKLSSEKPEKLAKAKELFEAGKPLSPI